MKKTIASLAIAAALVSVNVQAAIAIDLTGGPSQGTSLTFSDVVGDIDLTVTPSDDDFNAPDLVTQNANGLGVSSTTNCFFIFCNPGDPNPNLDTTQFFPEVLTFTFSDAVKLGTVGFSLFGGADDYRISVDGTEVPGNPFDDNPYQFGYVEATSFSVGVQFGDDLTDFPQIFDNFRVSSIQVAAVPLPAAGLVLLTALGGAAAAYRRRKS